MREHKKKKNILNIMIFVTACMWLVAVSYFMLPTMFVFGSLLFLIAITVVTLAEWFKREDNVEVDTITGQLPVDDIPAHELILLDENDEAIRTWDLTDRIAMIVGRKNHKLDVDIDLSNCEYSALISLQHAVLNYSLGGWYIEDLNSENRIRLKKNDDGNLYQVAPSHPVRVSAGDVIYIAKTKLLFM